MLHYPADIAAPCSILRASSPSALQGECDTADGTAQCFIQLKHSSPSALQGEYGTADVTAQCSVLKLVLNTTSPSVHDASQSFKKIGQTLTSPTV